MLMCGRNQYNIVKQLSSNLNKLKKKTDLYMGPQPCARQCSTVTDDGRLVKAVGKAERK